MKKRSKYLSQMMKEKEIEINENTLVISPCGSGKTYYIFNNLCKNFGRYLYLCDNKNLLTQIKYDIEDNNKGNIDVMTYAKFGREINLDTNDDFINKYDMIIADELHNLIDYESFDDNKYLSLAINKLMKRYENTTIAMFTGTPYYVKELIKINPHLKNMFTTIDFSDDLEIKRYINKKVEYINHISQIQFQLDSYGDSFKYGDCKCLIYTQMIRDMKTIEKMCEDRSLKCISLWSVSNVDNPMSFEQLKVRELLLREGKLQDDVDVLIINRSMETGVNIVDERIQLFICNTLNYTQQIQSRARLRFDVDFVILKTDDMNKKPIVTIDEKLLNIEFTKKEMEENLIIPFNFREQGNCRFLTVNKLIGILENSGYDVIKKVGRREGRQMTLYRVVKKS